MMPSVMPTEGLAVMPPVALTDGDTAAAENSRRAAASRTHPAGESVDGAVGEFPASVLAMSLTTVSIRPRTGATCTAGGSALTVTAGGAVGSSVRPVSMLSFADATGAGVSA